eukprot:762994-Hanusia_phi.AAC.7
MMVDQRSMLDVAASERPRGARRGGEGRGKRREEWKGRGKREEDARGEERWGRGREEIMKRGEWRKEKREGRGGGLERRRGDEDKRRQEGGRTILADVGKVRANDEVRKAKHVITTVNKEMYVPCGGRLPSLVRSLSASSAVLVFQGQQDQEKLCQIGKKLQSNLAILECKTCTESHSTLKIDHLPSAESTMKRQVWTLRDVHAAASSADREILLGNFVKSHRKYAPPLKIAYKDTTGFLTIMPFVIPAIAMYAAEELVLGLAG